MKLSAHPNPMPSENWAKSKCYQQTTVLCQVVGDLLEYLMACNYLS